MKRTTLILMVLLGLSIRLEAQRKEFSWLLGTWQLEDKSSYEQWNTAADGKTLMGISYRTDGADTILTEKITLTLDHNTFYYIPDVSGDQKPVRFKITKHDAQSFVAENPDHDFPTLIRYRFVRKEGHDTIDAAIEGGKKVINYTFVRIK